MIDLSKIWQKENINFTRRVLGQLEGDPHIPAILDYIDQDVVNIWLVLAYLAKRMRPERYAELGVRRGFSMAIVGARRQNAHLVGFDSWQANYAGLPNPGPEFVKSELSKVGHTGPVDLIAGNTAATVPNYKTGLLFPLILADADHSTDGVCRDIDNCLRLLAPGGYLVVDDLQDEAVKAAWVQMTNGSGLWAWQKDRVGIIKGV